MPSSPLVGSPGVDFGGQRRQFGLQGGGEVRTAFGYAKGGAVSGQPRFAFRPGKKLGTVVSEILSAHNVDDVIKLEGIKVFIERYRKTSKVILSDPHRERLICARSKVVIRT